MRLQREEETRFGVTRNWTTFFHFVCDAIQKEKKGGREQSPVSYACACVLLALALAPRQENVKNKNLRVVV